MKVITVYNSRVIRALNIEAITLYPFIIFSESKESYLDDNYYNKYSSIYRHELEHIYQVRKYGFLSFYISYLIIYFANLIRYKSFKVAYLNISYELEARKVEVRSLTEQQVKELGLD
jgi:hypothetical protein